VFEQGKAQPIGFVGSMQDGADATFTMLTRALFGGSDGRTRSAGLLAENEEDISQSRQTMPADFAVSTPITGIIQADVKASQRPDLVGVVKPLHVTDQRHVLGSQESTHPRDRHQDGRVRAWDEPLRLLTQLR
jgi:hypothetical protein